MFVHNLILDYKRLKTDYFGMVARRKAALAAIIFTILVLVAVNIGWWWYYNSITVYLEKQLSHRLSSAAATAALHIPVEMTEALLIEDLDAYTETLIYLDSLTILDSLSEASIIDLDFNYLVSSRQDFTGGGYLLARLNFDYLQGAISGRPTASALYDIDGTYLKSAYAPLWGDGGGVEAIVVVEAGAGYFELLDALRGNLYFLAGGSAGVVLILLVFYIIYSRRMAAAEEKIFRAGSQAALGRVVAVVSHEIKNPMMIIRAAGERLEKKYKEPEAAFITEEIARLDSIVSGYLSFARGDSVINPEAVDPGELVQKIVTEFSGQFAEKGVDLKADLDESLPPIKADRTGLRQVIINLLLNALQAAEGEGGDRGRVRLAISESGRNSKISIRVSNTGEKIKKSQREKLFEPFFTTKIQGSGLGLYLCRRIVEAHGGQIRIIDGTEDLTTFEVILPAGEQL